MPFEEIEYLARAHADALQSEIKKYRRSLQADLTAIFCALRSEIETRLASLGAQTARESTALHDIPQIMRAELVRIWQRMDQAVIQQSEQLQAWCQKTQRATAGRVPVAEEEQPPDVSRLPSADRTADLKIHDVKADIRCVIETLRARAKTHLAYGGAEPTLTDVMQQARDESTWFSPQSSPKPTDLPSLFDSVGNIFGPLSEEIVGLRYKLGAAIVEPITELDPEIAQRPLATIGLTKELLRALQSINITTVGQVLTKRRLDLRWRVHDIGRERMKQLEIAMASIGYVLGPLYGSPWQPAAERRVLYLPT